MIDRIHIPPILPADLVSGCRVVALSDVGRVREENQDYMGHAVRGSEQLLVVADGMGGHSGGFEASRIAVDALLNYFQESGEGTSSAEVLRTGIEQANARVRLAASENPMLRGMGSTITAALISDGHAHLAHVGDSRIYLIRDGQARLLTLDHSRITRMIEVGMITPEQAKNHPMGHILERSIGSSDSIDVELQSPVRLAQGDVLLLCSDGLWGLIEDEELSTIFQDPDLKTAAERAIGMAMQRGADDNTTLGVLRMEEGPEAADDISDVRTALYAKGAQEIAQREREAAERAKTRKAMASQIPAISHTPAVDDTPLMVENQSKSTDGRLWVVGAIIALLAILAGIWMSPDDDVKSASSEASSNDPAPKTVDVSEVDEEGSTSDQRATALEKEALPLPGDEAPVLEPDQDGAVLSDSAKLELGAAATTANETQSASEEADADRALGFEEAHEMVLDPHGVGGHTTGGSGGASRPPLDTRDGRPKPPRPGVKGPNKLKGPNLSKELSNFERNQERLNANEAPAIDLDDLYQSNAPPTIEQIQEQNAILSAQQEEMTLESEELDEENSLEENEADVQEPAPATGSSTEDEGVESD